LLELGLKTLIAYLLGSIVGALVVGQFRGVDIRTLGSGNAGGTTALRTQGLAFAAAVFIDVGLGLPRWLPGLRGPGVAADGDPTRLAHRLLRRGGRRRHVWPMCTLPAARARRAAALALAPVLLVIAWRPGFWSRCSPATSDSATVTAAAIAAASGFLAARDGILARVHGGDGMLIGWAHRGTHAHHPAPSRLGKLWLFRPRGPSG
jgi:glycerol-3-phosphate acyltransferase PlsY